MKHWMPSRFRAKTHGVSLTGELVTIGGSIWMGPVRSGATIVEGCPGQDAFELHTGPYKGEKYDEEGSR